MVDVKTYAISCHRDVNQRYQDKPYEFHLKMVVEIAERFIHLIPEKDREDVIAGCWVHDVIEDTGKTYNDVKKATNETIAEYAFALTNEKGRNREERANHAYYSGIDRYKHATFIKLCDRYANMKYSKDTGSTMFKMYQKEMDSFAWHLKSHKYEELWTALETLANN
jgi:(p)ppGpp synthase/HD superfamily hydrolase